LPSVEASTIFDFETLVLVLGLLMLFGITIICLFVFPIIRIIEVCRLVSKGCKLVGCGSAVPALEISNDELSQIVDTSDEWISVRTGIRRRRVLSG